MTWIDCVRAVVGLGALASGATALAADRQFTIDHGGLRRTYEVHGPAVGRGAPAPLVLVLHGGGAQDDQIGMIRELTGFNPAADAAGFVVAYPQAIDNYWNDGRGLTRYRSQAQNVDDVGFLVAVADQIAATHSIDRSRVYVAGASNGAMMAYRLACERPDRFAAIAAVAGNHPVRLACAPSRPIPVLVMNGTDDPLMPFGGGDVRFGPDRLGQVLSAEETVARWVAHDGCSDPPAAQMLPNRAPLDGTRVVRTSYSRCRGGASVEFYKVEGGGHTWPGGPQVTPRAVVGATSRDIEATETIWSFFARHALPGSPGGPGAGPSPDSRGPFRNPERIEIRGYDGHAMEPAISKDGSLLVFNDMSDRGPDKNLFWARRVSDLVFQFMGEVPGVNSSAVEASPSMASPDILFYTSLRDYPRSFTTLYQARFVDGRLSGAAPVQGNLYRAETPWASLDPDATPDGQTLFFVHGRFGASGPVEMDIRIARKAANGYEMDPRSGDMLQHVNTMEHLEYAPAISPDNLELFFTRGMKSPSGQVTSVHILRAVRSHPSDAFGPPEPVGAISGFVEAPSVAADSTSLYYHRKDGDRFVIYRVTRDRITGMQRRSMRRR